MSAVERWPDCPACKKPVVPMEERPLLYSWDWLCQCSDPKPSS